MLMRKKLPQTEALADKIPNFGGLDVCGMKITVYSKHRVLIENHSGILSLSADRIEVAGVREKLYVSGCDLEIPAMSRAELLISGVIQGVEWE